jgi:protein-S-isoprenylcysteine O-methyltransferase Ste14
MLPLIYTDSTAALAFGVAALIWYVPEAVGMLWQRSRVTRRGASVQDRGSMAVLLGLQWLGLGLGFALAGALPGAAITWQRPAVLGLGIGLMLLGVVLRWYAIWTLGRYFTRDVAVAADQPVVERGPYRWVRHPAYSGTLLTILGIGLALQNWAGLLALMALVLVGYGYRVRVEEAALAGTIGQPYRDYMRRTRRFIPWVF